jgi:hypothetical protein
MISRLQKRSTRIFGFPQLDHYRPMKPNVCYDLDCGKACGKALRRLAPPEATCNSLSRL